jgi:hypothetical protein
MTAPTSQAILTMLWDRQSVWSTTANRLKRNVVRSRLAGLILTTTGAILGTMSAWFDEDLARLGQANAIAAAVALALASLAGPGMSRRAIENWVRARSVAEAIKTEVYTYLAGVHPFRGEDRTELLLHRCDALVDLASDLSKHTSMITPRARALPDVAGVASYADVRVRDQISGYYRPRAKKMAVHARRLRWIEHALAVASALLAAAAGWPDHPGWPASWIGVLTTMSTAVAAHVGASRYEHQQIEFTRTADQLERLLAWQALGPDDPAAADEFVAACERTISIQNEGWMATMTTPVEFGSAEGSKEA